MAGEYIRLPQLAFETFLPRCAEVSIFVVFTRNAESLRLHKKVETSQETKSLVVLKLRTGLDKKYKYWDQILEKQIIIIE